MERGGARTWMVNLVVITSSGVSMNMAERTTKMMYAINAKVPTFEKGLYDFSPPGLSLPVPVPCNGSSPGRSTLRTVRWTTTSQRTWIIRAGIRPGAR